MTDPKYTKNVIDVNGKRYDAVSGAYLGPSPTAPVKNAAIHSLRAAHPATRGNSIDGMRSGSGAPPRADAPAMYSSAKPAHPAAQATASGHGLSALAQMAKRQPHTPGKHVSAHSPQRAITLMRGAVAKPAIKSPAVIKAQTRTDLLATVPSQSIIPKQPYSGVDSARRRHAERMVRSPAIRRFTAAPGAVAEPVVYALRAEHPVKRPAVGAAADMSGFKSSGQSLDFVRQPIAATPAASGHAALPRSLAAPGHPGLAPANRTPHDSRRTADLDIFEQALADARSHEQTYQGPAGKAKRRHRLFRVAAGSLVVLLLFGFLAYKNAPNISLAVASYRAGVHAKLPTYDPAGFNLGFLDYQPGNVTVNFTSPRDGRQFNITQKASSWDSQALLSNFVSTANDAYQTYERAGRTVYLLKGGTATWVDSGVWYTIDSNSSLSSNQLLDLASSM